MTQEDLPPIVHALSGAIGSCVANTCVYPLDLVTTRLQTQSKKIKVSDHSGETYEGLLDAFRRIYNKKGVSAFYRGVLEDNFSTMSSTFTYHFAYNYIRDRRMDMHMRRTGKHPRVLGMVEELSIGAFAGIISRFLTSPASNVVTRQQTRGNSTTQVISDIYSEKGLTGFWSGFKASIVLAANPSIAYYLFEVQKALLIPKNRRDDPRALEIFIFSASGKALATFLLYPFILIKSKMQAKSARTGLSVLVASILKKEGLYGLYEGCSAQVLKGFLSQGIMMLLKDKIGALIVSLYVIMRKARGRTVVGSTNAFQNFVDPPKQDLNGLIESAKDKIEDVVDAVVDRAKNIATATNAGVNMHKVEDMIEAGKESAQSLMNTASKAAIDTFERAHMPNATTTKAKIDGVEWEGQVRKRNS